MTTIFRKLAQMAPVEVFVIERLPDRISYDKDCSEPGWYWNDCDIFWVGPYNTRGEAARAFEETVVQAVRRTWTTSP